MLVIGAVRYNINFILFLNSIKYCFVLVLEVIRQNSNSLVKNTTTFSFHRRNGLKFYCDVYKQVTKTVKGKSKSKCSKQLITNKNRNNVVVKRLYRQ